MNISRPGTGTEDAHASGTSILTITILLPKATLSHPRPAGGLSLKHTCSIQQRTFLALVHPRCRSPCQVR